LQISLKRKKELKTILKKISINFRNYSLLNLALSHRSYVNEKGFDDNNEKLEFLGDSILGFVITEFLYKELPEYNEGDLARIKSFVISESTLTKIAKKIGLNKYILIGKGEETSGGRNKKTIISDAFEAFLGSYYLDSNFTKVKQLIIKLFKDEIILVVENKHEKDYKTLLQEYSQKKYKVCPIYKLTNKRGPEHDVTFFMQVLINDKIYGVGQGKSKKDAEKEAAKNAFKKINSSFILSTYKKNKSLQSSK
jgi:ribonuclease III